MSFKLGDPVEFEDDHGNKRKGKVVNPGHGEPEGIGVEWTEMAYFSSHELRHVSAVDRLAELAS